MSQSDDDVAAWNLRGRIAFRFLFAYVLLYCPPLSSVWFAVAPSIARFFGHDIGLSARSGSGDSSFHYLQVLNILVLAAVVTLVWSLLDSRRKSYATLHAALRVYVRYFLAATLLGYGMSKVFKSQFPFPSPERLMQPLGEFSPMGLLWNFMGYSVAYTVFTGAGEVLAGLLLFARRTTALGALLAAAIMTHVVMLNFSYDVPVKLFSMHLLALALFLLAPDSRRLADVLWFNRPTSAAVLRTPFANRWLERASLMLKIVCIAAIVISTAVPAWTRMTEYGDGALPPALYGLYDVETFERNGHALPPLTTDVRRWRRVAVNRFGYCVIQRMDESRTFFQLADDSAQQTATLAAGTRKHVLAYRRPDSEHLLLTGTFEQEEISVGLRRIDASRLPLVSRGFHWINEYPYNR